MASRALVCKGSSFDLESSVKDQHLKRVKASLSYQEPAQPSIL